MRGRRVFADSLWAPAARRVGNSISGVTATHLGPLRACILGELRSVTHAMTLAHSLISHIKYSPSTDEEPNTMSFRAATPALLRAARVSGTSRSLSVQHLEAARQRLRTKFQEKVRPSESHMAAGHLFADGAFPGVTVRSIHPLARHHRGEHHAFGAESRVGDRHLARPLRIARSLSLIHI